MKAMMAAAAAAALGLAACGGAGDENVVNEVGNQANVAVEANASDDGKETVGADANAQETAPPASGSKEGGPSAPLRRRPPRTALC